jgi:hypothetical protein
MFCGPTRPPAARRPPFVREQVPAHEHRLPAGGDEQGAAGFSHKTSREMNAGLRTSSRTPLLVHAAE